MSMEMEISSAQGASVTVFSDVEAWPWGSATAAGAKTDGMRGA
jgi:hypothetical protein